MNNFRRFIIQIGLTLALLVLVGNFTSPEFAQAAQLESPVSVTVSKFPGIIVNSGSTNTDERRNAGAVSVAGNRILRDGVPWAPRGAVMVAFVAPPAAQKGVFTAAYQHFSAAELSAAKAWGIDTLRFQVSQPAVDPQNSLHSEAFISQVKNAVLTARLIGLNVILSIQDEVQSGESSPAVLPNAATQRVWQVLAPMFKDDLGVLYELINEPQPKPSPQNWQNWATSMNSTINTVRSVGAKNVVIADGLGFAEYLEGASLLNDPRDQVIYGSHPYAHNAEGQTEDSWQAKFGSFAEKAPVMVTEWTTTVPFYCDTNTPTAALQFFRYLQDRGIGVVMFGYDFVASNKFGSIVQDFHGTPTRFNGLMCGDAGFGPGSIVQDWYRSGFLPDAVK